MGCGTSAQKLSSVPKAYQPPADPTTCSSAPPDCNQSSAIEHNEGSSAPPDCNQSSANEHNEEQDDSGPRTIVLVGVTGDGKSSTGNSLVGHNAFQVSGGLCSETSGPQFAQFLHVNAQSELEEYRCIDTIGLHDTGLPAEEVLSRFTQFGDLCPLGIDVFLFVVRWGRFKPEHEAALDSFLANCGEGVLRHTSLVFTHCSLAPDELKVQLENHSPPGLQRLLPTLGGAPVGIDNIQDPAGARELLRKAVAASCGGARYSNRALLEARKQHDVKEEEERAAFAAAVADWRKGGVGRSSLARECDQVVAFEAE